MSKYQYGVIYKIINSINPMDIYIGSTTSDLEIRFVKHKSDAKNRPHLSNLYTYMNCLGVEHFDIELVEECSCNSKEELFQREGEIIREIGTLNQRIAGRTNAEYKKEFEEYLKECARKYRKQWRIDNREHYLEKERGYKKTYREKYKEQIREKQSQKVECECGGHYTLSHKAEHMKSKKHLKAMGTYNEEEYKQSERCEKLKTQYDKYKDTIDEEQMKEHKKKSYEKHKDEYSKNSKERMICECGADICKGAYLRHCKSKFHQNFILNNNIDNVRLQEEEQQQEKHTKQPSYNNDELHAIYG